MTAGRRRCCTWKWRRTPRFIASSQAADAAVSEESDWTCRVLVGGLKPDHVYWYRFTDGDGYGSRLGRTITAPGIDEPRAVRFAFVSCQSVNEGAQNAYRRMIWEDQRAPAERRLGFVLHLGDFIYEVVEYPDEVPHRYDRTVYDIGRVPDGRKVDNFHVPTTLDGYRMVYRAHIRDPDIQDARAYFPFVCIGDNHEFSWQGWQSFIKYDGKAEPAQALRVAANQAWWEYIPSRVRKASGPALDRFDGPKVENAPITRLDEDGLGEEANNLAAISSMTGYRAMRFGRHVELILTDFHSYTMQDPTTRDEAEAFDLKDFPEFFPQEALEILEAGRTYNGGNPPQSIPLGSTSVENFARNDPAYTVLGRVQKDWLKRTLAASTSTWKIWGATNGTLDMRTDPLNLPAGLTTPWPGQGYATFGGGDFSAALTERGELYDFVRDGQDHRVRNRLWRSAQLLGRLRRKGPAAQGLRSGRRGLHLRLDFGAWDGGGVRASAERPPAQASVRERAPAGEVRIYDQPDREARRQKRARVCAHRQPASRARGKQPRQRTPSGVRRYGWAWLRGRHRWTRGAGDGVCLHSPADRASTDPGWRPIALPG